MAQRIYILGGHQTDFAQNWSRQGAGIFDILQQSVLGALDDAALDGTLVEVAHIGNFVGELFARQGNLGGFLSYIDAGLTGIPATRHEGACASGSLAALAAMADIESGRYGCALVTGVELMRNVPGQDAAEYLGAAAWAGRETEGRQYVWPSLFSDMAVAYDARYGLDRRHLGAISRKNHTNAKANPVAQARSWQFDDTAYSDDEDANPTVEGMIRRSDCGQITDGAATIILAGQQFADAWAAKRGISLDAVPYISGWGHTSAPMMLSTKIENAPPEGYLFPWVRKAITDAYGRAGISGPDMLDGIELHDCFSITEYMLTEHFGITAPGQAWQALESGNTHPGGRIPVNMSGGLIGCGHPVGATGIRMLNDIRKQLSGIAGDCQIEDARRMATFNVGGSGVTNVSFIAERAS